MFLFHHPWGEVSEPCCLCGVAVAATFRIHQCTTGVAGWDFISATPFWQSPLVVGQIKHGVLLSSPMGGGE